MKRKLSADEVNFYLVGLHSVATRHEVDFHVISEALNEQEFDAAEKNYLTQLRYTYSPVTPLLIAIFFGLNEAVTRLLVEGRLREGAGIDMPAVLIIACGRGHSAVVKKVLSYDFLFCNLSIEQGNRLIHLAWLQNDLELVRYLLEEKQCGNLYAVNEFGQTLLDVSVIHYMTTPLDNIDYLLAQNVPLNYDINPNFLASIIIQYGISSPQKLERIIFAIEKLGVIVSLRDIAVAAKHTSYTILFYLMQYMLIDYKTPLFHGKTLLHYAAQNINGSDIINRLTHIGILADSMDNNGNTPLHETCFFDHEVQYSEIKYRLVNFLNIANHATVSFVTFDSNNKSPLQLALDLVAPQGLAGLKNSFINALFPIIRRLPHAIRTQVITQISVEPYLATKLQWEKSLALDLQRVNTIHAMANRESTLFFKLPPMAVMQINAEVCEVPFSPAKTQNLLRLFGVPLLDAEIPVPLPAEVIPAAPEPTHILRSDFILQIQNRIQQLNRESLHFFAFHKARKTEKMVLLNQLKDQVQNAQADRSLHEIIQTFRQTPGTQSLDAGFFSHRTRDMLNHFSHRSQVLHGGDILRPAVDFR